MIYESATTQFSSTISKSAVAYIHWQFLPKYDVIGELVFATELYGTNELVFVDEFASLENLFRRWFYVPVNQFSNEFVSPANQFSLMILYSKLTYQDLFNDYNDCIVWL